MACLTCAHSTQLELPNAAAEAEARRVIDAIDSMRAVCVEVPAQSPAKRNVVRGPAASLKTILSFGSGRVGQAIRSDVDETLERIADDTVDVTQDVEGFEPVSESKGLDDDVEDVVDAGGEGKPLSHRRGGAVGVHGMRLSEADFLGLGITGMAPIAPNAVPVPEWQRLMRNINVRTRAAGRRARTHARHRRLTAPDNVSWV